MEWLTQNWFWILIFVAFIGMHLFGHGGHGSHGGHGGHGGHAGHGRGGGGSREDASSRQAKDTPPSTGHQH